MGGVGGGTSAPRVVKEKCRDIRFHSMRTACRSVKSGTAADCFTLHQWRSTVVAERRGAAVCKHYKSRGNLQGLGCLKRDWQRRILTIKEDLALCKSAGGKTLLFELYPNRFHSLVNKKRKEREWGVEGESEGGGRKSTGHLQSHLDEELKTWLTFLPSPGGNSSFKSCHL